MADPEGYWRVQGLTLIAGVDEVGRGPLAGPVVAAAVILPAGFDLPKLRDSKRLIPEIRLELDGQIRRQALALAVREVGPRQIERQGILTASLAAMAQAIRALSPPAPEMVLV
ncbi:MAG TPA: ribonuclease HII, partial [Desulfobaccales bacterium]|nr:ribonuclease HII [Desulfobaccales bacterium]